MYKVCSCKKEKAPQDEEEADEALEKDVVKAKKMIVAMNGTLESICSDIEKSQTKL